MSSRGQGRHRLRYFVADAWDEFTHSPGVNLLAVATLTAALFVAGLALLMLTNVTHRVDWLRGDVPIVVYLQDGIDADTVEELRSRIEPDSGVGRVDYIGKQEALRRYRRWSLDAAELIGELEGNPLPASLEVFPNSDADGPQVAGRIQQELLTADGVEHVAYDREWVQELSQLMSVARWGGLLFGLFVALAVAFVIAAVLRLAVYARRDEIEIMQLVGATPSFIRGPFLVAGLVHGLSGALLALFLVEIVRRVLVSYHGPATAIVVDLFASAPLAAGPALIVLASGLVVGLFGARLAVRL